MVENIRAKRKKGGLLRQHLTAFKAVVEITGGEAEGMHLGAKRLAFTPGPAKGGEYHFAIGSAGSAGLVFQTVLWPLLFADGPSRVVFEGGTHNDMAPPFDFLEIVFLPQLRKMGAAVDMQLERYGFYPAGGAPLRGGHPTLQGIEAAGAIDGRGVEGAGGHGIVRGAAAARWRAGAECRAAGAGLAHGRMPPPRREGLTGPGNVLMLRLAYEHVCEIVTAFGRRGTARSTWP